MKDFVSSHWISVIALVASMSVVCAIFVPYGFPWTGLGWASLALSAAVLLAMRSTGSIRQVIYDVEAEPGLAVALSERLATPVGGAPLRLKGERTL